MKNILLCTSFIVLSACASSPKYDNITKVQLQQAFDKFKAQQGGMVAPVRGKFKEVAAWKSSSIGSHGFTCSGTDTIKYVRYMNIHTGEDGIVTAKSIENDCGRVRDPKTLSGFQTKSHLFLYPSDLNSIAVYKIAESSGKLTHLGNYKSKKGSLVFNESRQNNETWSQGLGNNYSYKTTSFSPEALWPEVDRFERNIVVKQGGSAAGGFQWGKALALGVGAVAGGGLSLDSATQASVISGIVLDSQADTTGTTSFNNAVQASIETNAKRAAANSEIEQDTAQNSTSVEEEPVAQPSAVSTSSPLNPNSTPNNSIPASKCGVSSYTLAEEQAEKDRLGAIMQSKLVNVPAYDYKTRNQAWRDWGAALDDWRKARHEACGIDTSRTSRVTIE